VRVWRFELRRGVRLETELDLARRRLGMEARLPSESACHATRSARLRSSCSSIPRDDDWMYSSYCLCGLFSAPSIAASTSKPPLLIDSEAPVGVGDLACRGSLCPMVASTLELEDAVSATRAADGGGVLSRGDCAGERSMLSVAAEFLIGRGLTLVSWGLLVAAAAVAAATDRSGDVVTDARERGDASEARLLPFKPLESDALRVAIVPLG
jgi:hypothetical protein